MDVGSVFRDPGCGKNLFPDPGSKRHCIPDPDPQHWEKQTGLNFNCAMYFVGLVS
jgi:hypothetical protein